MDTLVKLIDLLTLKRLGENKFVGENFQAPWGRVFGGQVLAQSLYAAYQTVPEDRIAHSMHGYFILGGNLDIPITYEVDTIRNGGSFTTRRVVAYQADTAIFNMAASFHIKEKGIAHQITMPNVLPPEKLNTARHQLEEIKTTDPDGYERLKMLLPEVFDFKPIERITSQLMRNSEPLSHLWMKTHGEQKEVLGVKMQQLLLAYVSDYNLLTTATLPHRELLNKELVLYASLDHALWFHREFDIQDWLLYAIDSPSASNSRGFSRGSIFNRSGELVASVAQEGLVRMSNSR